jgi:hypothetical protein
LSAICQPTVEKLVAGTRNTLHLEFYRARAKLGVHECSEQFAVPILHIARLVQSSLEQRLESLLRFRPRQRRRERREAVEEPVG